MFTSSGWAAAAGGVGRSDPSHAPDGAQGRAREQSTRSVGLVVVHGVGRQQRGDTVELLRSPLTAATTAGTPGRLFGRRVIGGAAGASGPVEPSLTLEALLPGGMARVRIYEAYWADLDGGKPAAAGAEKAGKYTDIELVGYRLWLLGTLFLPLLNLVRGRYRARPLSVALFAWSYLMLAVVGTVAHVSDALLRLVLGLPGFADTRRKVNRVILEYAGDVYRYVRRGGRERGPYLERFRLAFEQAAAENDEVQVLGHSLGSVIAFDALTGGILRPESAARLSVLHTWGSPLDKFYFVWPGLIRFELDPVPARPVHWLNWHHRRDPIGARLDFFDRVAGIEPPVNRGYTSGGSLASAHTDYWTRPPVAATLLEALGLRIEQAVEK